MAFKPQSPITRMLHGVFSQGIPTYVAYKMAEKAEQDKWKKLKEEWKQQALLKEIDYYANIVTDTKNPPTIRGQAARQMEELLGKTPYSAVMGGGGGVTGRPQAFPTTGNMPSYPEDKLRVSGMPTLGRPNPFSMGPLAGEGMPTRRPALSEMLSNMPAQPEREHQYPFTEPEVKGYDIFKAGLKPAGEDKVAEQVRAQVEKQKAQAESDFLVAMNKLKTTMAAFKAMTQFTGGAGRLPGALTWGLGKAGINPYVNAYKGQLIEAAAALAKLAAPSARVGEEIIRQFKKTLPTISSTTPEAINQIRFSLRNAFATALGRGGGIYTPEIEARIDQLVNEIANVEPMTLEGLKRIGVQNVGGTPSTIEDPLGILK